MDRPDLTNSEAAVALEHEAGELHAVAALVLTGGSLSTPDRKRLRDCEERIRWLARQLAPGDA